MKLATYRRALRVGLHCAFHHEPGLSFPEIMILLHTPYDSEADIFDLLPRPQGEVSVYVRSLVAHDLLEQGGKRGPYTLTAKGESLFTPTRS